jgi:hypothetical protein
VITLFNRSMGRAAALAALLTLPWANAAPAATAQQPDLTVPAGFRIDVAARVPGARELTVLPDGDLIVGTKDGDVYVLPDGEAATPGEPAVYATTSDGAAAGVAFSQRHDEIYIATEHAVFATSYAPGRRKAAELRKIASVRSGPIAPHSDGDVHTTTSIAVSERTDTLYVAVGSSCNACVEADSTRASIFSMKLPSGPLVKRATRIRNAIALAVDPIDGALWAGDAGQDDCRSGIRTSFSTTSRCMKAWPITVGRSVKKIAKPTLQTRIASKPSPRSSNYPRIRPLSVRCFIPSSPADDTRFRLHTAARSSPPRTDRGTALPAAAMQRCRRSSRLRCGTDGRSRRSTGRIPPRNGIRSSVDFNRAARCVATGALPD